ncbi:MAG: glycosyltransferase [Acidimicrobiales bacterium]
MSAQTIGTIVRHTALTEAAIGRSSSPSSGSNIQPRSLSVVVCTKDRPEKLVRCLQSVARAFQHLEEIESELIVVDNAPSDDRTRTVVTSMKGVKYVAEPLAGLDVARNRGLRAASREVVAFIDDDAVVDRWWAEALMEAWAAEPDSVVITGAVLPYELETQAQILFELGGGFTADFKIRRFGDVPLDRAWAAAATCGAGCNMSVNRGAALRMGGFDENLDTGPPLSGGGDLDLFYQAIVRGGPLVYEPSVVVFHEHRRTCRELLRQYRSWGTTWTTCVTRPRADGGLTRRNAWRQVFIWYVQRLHWLRSAGWQGAVALLGEIPGMTRGLTGEYRRSRRRMDSRRRAVAKGNDQPGLTVAILPWGHVIEDYLDTISVTLDEFLEEMSGGWLFGYIDALQESGIRPLLIVVSSAARRSQRRVHSATGAIVWVLPSPRSYRWLRKHLPEPYAFNWRQAVKAATGIGRIWSVPIWAAGSWLNTPILALARTLRRERCDVLLCQEYEEARFDLCCTFRRLLGVRLFATFQGGAHTRRFERRVRGWAVRNSDGLLIADVDEASRVVAAHRVDPGLIAPVPNPFRLEPLPDAHSRAEARKELGLVSDASVVLWYGRVDRQPKGLDVLLDAWDLVARRRPDDRMTVLMIVGSGPDAGWLRERLTSTEGKVFWHDKFVLDRRILALRLAAADIFVQPSRNEGFAVAPMEAMAASVPVIAADAQGIRRLLTEDTGVIVSRKDSQALADAIRLLLDDPVRARALGARGRDRVEAEFSTTAVGQALADVFASDGNRRGQ